MQFEAVIISCSEQQCPSFGIVIEANIKLDEHGCRRWMTCGVCQSTLIADPHPPVQQTQE